MRNDEGRRTRTGGRHGKVAPVLTESQGIRQGGESLRTLVAAVPRQLNREPHGPKRDSLECDPRPLNVSTAKPSHWMEGSKVEPHCEPTVMLALRRRVLSAVLVSPVPHSVVGLPAMTPRQSTMVPALPPLRRRTASLPVWWGGQQPQVAVPLAGGWHGYARRIIMAWLLCCAHVIQSATCPCEIGARTCS